MLKYNYQTDLCAACEASLHRQTPHISFMFEWPPESVAVAMKNGSLISSSSVDMCLLFPPPAPLIPSVFHQPVSTTRTNVNLTSKQPLSPQLYRLKGLICESSKSHCFPPWRATCQESHFLPVPQMSPDEAPSLKCSNNTLSREPTCASSRETLDGRNEARGDIFPKTCNLPRLWWPCVCLRLDSGEIIFVLMVVENYFTWPIWQLSKLAGLGPRLKWQIIQSSQLRSYWDCSCHNAKSTSRRARILWYACAFMTSKWHLRLRVTRSCSRLHFPRFDCLLFADSESRRWSSYTH